MPVGPVATSPACLGEMLGQVPHWDAVERQRFGTPSTLPDPNGKAADPHKHLWTKLMPYSRSSERLRAASCCHPLRTSRWVEMVIVLAYVCLQ